MSRTVRDFVKTLCREGLDDAAVYAVGANTRWRDKPEEIRNLLLKRGSRWRQMGGREKLNPTQVKRIFKFSSSRFTISNR